MYFKTRINIAYSVFLKCYYIKQTPFKVFKIHSPSYDVFLFQLPDTTTVYIVCVSVVGGDSQTLISVTQHILFLLTGVLISLFLQLSLACRFILLAAVVANITLVYHKQPLNFLHLTGAIAGKSIYFLLLFLLKCMHRNFDLWNQGGNFFIRNGNTVWQLMLAFKIPFPTPNKFILVHLSLSENFCLYFFICDVEKIFCFFENRTVVIMNTESMYLTIVNFPLDLSLRYPVLPLLSDIQ